MSNQRAAFSDQLSAINELRASKMSPSLQRRETFSLSPLGGEGWVRGISRIILSFMFLAALLLSAFSMAEAMQIDDILKAFVKDNYPWAEVDISDIVLSSELPPGQPGRILVQRGLPNRTVFILEYSHNKRLTVSAFVRTFDWAVMTRRALQKGDVLEQDDFYTALMESSRIPKDAVRVSDQLVGTVLGRSIPANLPLLTAMVQESQQVKRGQRVMIIAESEIFSISAKGELKENGYVGNDVKVLNLDSKKVIIGRLVDEKTVKVVF